MMTFGLLGQQISYSKSPVIHQYMARFLNIPFRYQLFDVDKKDIPEIISKLKTGEYHGLNVTIPYKEEVLKYVDQLTPHAERVGAVNTLYYKDDHIIGDNTDYEGFKGLLKLNHIKVKNKRVYILGTGGAAKAAYTVLNDLKAIITVVSRKPHLSKVFPKIVSYQSLHADDVDIIVNTTPVGTYPQVNDSPLNKAIVKDKIVIDFIYNPLETKLMKDARLGINGLDMLMIQAIYSEMAWLHKKIKINTKLIKHIKEELLHE